MKLAAIEFDDFTKTFMALLAHLTPAYYRLKNHYQDTTFHKISSVKTYHYLQETVISYK